MQSFQSRGRRWKEISRELVGRSENAIKNRFTLITRKYGNDLDKHTHDKKTAAIIKRLAQAVEKHEESEQLLHQKLEMLEQSNDVQRES